MRTKEQMPSELANNFYDYGDIPVSPLRDDEKQPVEERETSTNSDTCTISETFTNKPN